MIYEKLSPKQLKSMFWWSQNDTKNYDAVVCDGSVRSGKTMSMTVGFVLWSMKNFSGENFAFCGKTIDSLKRNMITPMQKWLEGIVKIKVNLSRNFLNISMCGHKNRYYFFGGKDESSYQLIQGITLAGVLLDEVALMPKSFVEQALARCSVTGSKLWFNCNPDSSEHWFFKEWIDENSPKIRQKNRLHLHFTMDDNFSLSDEVKQRYERMYSGVFYDRYIKGLWVLAEGLVYGTAFRKERHIVENYTPTTTVAYYISVDYGTLNPCSMGLWAVENDKAVRIKEYYYDGRRKSVQKTDEEYYRELEKLADGYKIQHIIIDPSAASFIATIKKHNRFSVRKARNDILNGIRATIFQSTPPVRGRKQLFTPKILHTIRFDCKTAYLNFLSCLVLCFRTNFIIPQKFFFVKYLLNFIDGDSMCSAITEANSVLEDTDKEFQRRLQMVNAEILTKEKFISWYFHCDENQANAYIPQFDRLVLVGNITFTNVTKPLFSYFRVPSANDIDLDSPLGISVYARAVDLIRQADEQWARIEWEYESKETALDVSMDMIKENSLPKRKNRIYRKYDVDNLDGNFYNIFSPEIRDSAQFNYFNRILQRIEFNCGLAYGTLSDPQTVEKTAEEIKTSKQRSYTQISAIQRNLETAINDLFYAVSVYAKIGGISGNNAKIIYTWGDSVLEDTDKEFQRRLQMVNSGILTKEKFISWYFHCDENQANAYIPQSDGLFGGV